MQNIKEVFSSLSERFKNPFYSVFVSSWLIINWRIVFITFSSHYSTDDKLDKISKIIHEYQFSVWLPLLVAILFFFGYKWIELGAASYNSWLKKLRENNELKLMGKHSVQGSEFLEITKKLEDLNRNYIELRGVKAQNEFDIIELEKSLNEKTDLIKTLNQTILDKPYLENKENLIGEWVVKYEDSNFLNFLAFNLNISKSGTFLKFTRIEPQIQTDLGYMSCFESDSGFIRFLVVSGHIKPYIYGEFMVLNVDKSGKFIRLSGKFTSDDKAYDHNEVEIFRKENFYFTNH